jgi:hypothetical protein
LATAHDALAYLAKTDMATAHDTLAYLAEANPTAACDTYAHTPFDMAESAYLAALADQDTKADFAATVDATTLYANLAAGANAFADANSDSLSYR